MAKSKLGRDKLQLIVETEGTQEVIEGCLSIPGKWGKLTRPAKVIVKALNEKGEEVIIAGEGDLAKCLCHEIDHLEGILFIDKVTEFIEGELLRNSSFTKIQL